MEVIYSIGVRFGGGGIGNVALQAVRGIHRHGFLKKLIVGTDESGEFDKKKVREVFLPRALNKAMYIAGLNDVKRSLVTDALFDRLACRHVERCDIFHVWGNFGLKSLRKAKSLGAVTVIERASSHPLTQNRLLDEEYRRFLNRGYITGSVQGLIDRAVAEMEECDYITVPSEFAADSLVENGVDGKKLLLLPFGVDTGRFRPREKKDDTFRAVFIGQVSVRKGILYLLEAWKGINLPGSELVVVGPHSPDIKELLAGYSGIKNIRFVDYVSDLTRVYHTASVFVFPTIEEGSALVNYEAMASGIPVITTYNSGSLARDGVDGFVIPVRDVVAIRDKLTALYEDPGLRDKMGESARERMERYTWEAYGDNLVEEYKKIAGQSLHGQAHLR